MCHQNNMHSIHTGMRLLVSMLLAASVVLGGASGCTPSQIPDSTGESQTMPVLIRVPTRTIVDSSLSLHEIWRLTPLLLGGGAGSADTPSSRTLSATRAAVYVVEHDPASNDPRRPLRIVALDTETGRELWRTERFGYLHSFASSSSALFVATVDGITAYNAVDGKRKWTSDQPPPEHQEYALFFDEAHLNLLIRWGSDYSYLTIDLASGAVGNTQQDNRILISVDSQFRYIWDGTHFWPEDIATSKVKWIVTIPESPNPPIRSQGILVIPSVQQRPGWHSVTIVNDANGQIMWDCVACYASDVAVDKDRLYAILRDGSLAEYDLETGRLRGMLRFAGGHEIEPLNTQYSVATADGTVILYFEDSQELIAFVPN